MVNSSFPFALSEVEGRNRAERSGFAAAQQKASTSLSPNGFWRKGRAKAFFWVAALLIAAPAHAADAPCKLTAKQVVERFSQLFFIEKKPVEAYELYVAPDYVQHNPIATDGRDAAIKALGPIFAANPDLKVDIKRIIGDDSHVAVHYHSIMKPGTKGFAAVDMFRVKDCRIVEHWDVIQAMPDASANAHPMF